jgi:hypothetical protein
LLPYCRATPAMGQISAVRSRGCGMSGVAPLTDLPASCELVMA